MDSISTSQPISSVLEKTLFRLGDFLEIEIPFKSWLNQGRIDKTRFEEIQQKTQKSAETLYNQANEVLTAVNNKLVNFTRQSGASHQDIAALRRYKTNLEDLIAQTYKLEYNSKGQQVPKFRLPPGEKAQYEIMARATALMQLLGYKTTGHCRSGNNRTAAWLAKTHQIFLTMAASLEGKIPPPAETAGKLAAPIIPIGTLLDNIGETLGKVLKLDFRKDHWSLGGYTKFYGNSIEIQVGSKGTPGTKTKVDEIPDASLRTVVTRGAFDVAGAFNEKGLNKTKFGMLAEGKLTEAGFNTFIERVQDKALRASSARNEDEVTDQLELLEELDKKILKYQEHYSPDLLARVRGKINNAIIDVRKTMPEEYHKDLGLRDTLRQTTNQLERDEISLILQKQAKVEAIRTMGKKISTEPNNAVKLTQAKNNLVSGYDKDILELQTRIPILQKEITTLKNSLYLDVEPFKTEDELETHHGFNIYKMTNEEIRDISDKALNKLNEKLIALQGKNISNENLHLIESASLKELKTALKGYENSVSRFNETLNTYQFEILNLKKIRGECEHEKMNLDPQKLKNKEKITELTNLITQINEKLKRRESDIVILIKERDADLSKQLKLLNEIQLKPVETPLIPGTEFKMEADYYDNLLISAGEILKNRDELTDEQQLKLLQQYKGAVDAHNKIEETYTKNLNEFDGKIKQLRGNIEMYTIFENKDKVNSLKNELERMVAERESEVFNRQFKLEELAQARDAILNTPDNKI